MSGGGFPQILCHMLRDGNNDDYTRAAASAERRQQPPCFFSFCPVTRCARGLQPLPSCRRQQYGGAAEQLLLAPASVRQHMSRTEVAVRPSSQGAPASSTAALRALPSVLPVEQASPRSVCLDIVPAEGLLPFRCARPRTTPAAAAQHHDNDKRARPRLSWGENRRPRGKNRRRQLEERRRGWISCGRRRLPPPWLEPRPQACCCPPDPRPPPSKPTFYLPKPGRRRQRHRGREWFGWTRIAVRYRPGCRRPTTRMGRGSSRTWRGFC